MKVTKFEDKKNKKEKWTTMIGGKKYMADVNKYPTEEDFVKYVEGKLDNKWPSRFLGKGEYRGQSFEKVDIIDGFVIYKWWPTASPSKITYDIFPATMDDYPTPEDFPDPAQFVQTFEQAKQVIYSLNKI